MAAKRAGAFVLHQVQRLNGLRQIKRGAALPRELDGGGQLASIPQTT